MVDRAAPSWPKFGALALIYTFGILAMGLAIAAWNSSGGTRIFLAVCCVLNLVGIAKAIYTEDPYAFKLRPNPHNQEESIRR